MPMPKTKTLSVDLPKGEMDNQGQHLWTPRATVGYRCQRCWKICMDPNSCKEDCIDAKIAEDINPFRKFAVLFSEKFFGP